MFQEGVGRVWEWWEMVGKDRVCFKFKTALSDLLEGPLIVEQKMDWEWEGQAKLES